MSVLNEKVNEVRLEANVIEYFKSLIELVFYFIPVNLNFQW